MRAGCARSSERACHVAKGGMEGHATWPREVWRGVRTLLREGRSFVEALDECAIDRVPELLVHPLLGELVREVARELGQLVGFGEAGVVGVCGAEDGLQPTHFECVVDVMDCIEDLRRMGGRWGCG